MTIEQTILAGLLVLVMALLLWGRWRYDLVAFSALLVAVVAGVVPGGKAFEAGDGGVGRGDAPSASRGCPLGPGSSRVEQRSLVTVEATGVSTSGQLRS